VRRRAEQGFTLLELVLALSIVAVMLTILFGGLRVGLRAWQRGEERAEALEHARSLGQVIEQTLAGVYAFQGRIDTNTQARILFEGEAEKVSLVTVSPPLALPGAIAFTAVTLSVEAVPASASPSGRRPSRTLTRSRRSSRVWSTDRDGYPLPLPPRHRWGSSWEDTWDGVKERGLPRAVEVTLTTIINGLPYEQAPITVPVRVTTP